MSDFKVVSILNPLSVSVSGMALAGVSDLGNTAGTTGLFSNQMVLVGGSNITLSQSVLAGSGTVSIHGGAGGGGGVAVSAGTQSANTGTVLFADSNGISFGMSDSSQITATLGTNGIPLHNSNNHSGNIIPAAVQDFGNFAYSLGTAGAPAASAGRLVFYGFNQNGKTRFGMVTPDGTEVVHAQDNFIIVRNTSGSTIDAGKAVYVTGSTGQTPNVSPAQADSAATMPAVGLTIDSIGNNAFGRVMISGIATDLDTSSFTEGDRLWVSAATAGDLTATEPAYPNLRQRVAIVVNVHATQGKLLVLIAGARGEFGVQALSAGTTRLTSGEAIFSDLNGISFGIDGNTVTASHNGITQQSTQPGIQSVSAGTTNITTGEVVFSNANGVSFGADGQTVTASHNALTSQSNQALSGSNGSFAFQTATFGNLNGLSFYTSNGSLVGSYTVPAGADAIRGIAAGGSTATTSTVNFSNSNGISFGFGAAGDSTVITASHNAITSQSNQIITVFLTNNTVAGLATSGTLNASSVIFQPSVNASMGFNAGSIAVLAGGRCSVPAGTFSYTTLAFSNANGVSWGTSGGASHITASVAAQTNQTGGIYALGNTTGQSSSSTYDARTLSIVGDGIASVGWSNGSLRISVPAGGGGLTNINVSAGTTSQNLSNIHFSDGGNVSFGLNGSTITANAPAGGGGATISAFIPVNFTGSMFHSQIGNASIQVNPVAIREDAVFSLAHVAGSISISSSSNSSHAGTLSLAVGFYTKNAGTLSFLTSLSRSYAWTNTSNNSTVSLQGGRRFQLTVAAPISLTAGNYWIALWSRTSTGNANWWTGSNLLFSRSGTYSGDFLAATAVTAQSVLGQGFFSATSTNLPVSMAFSHITGTQAAAGMNPWCYFANFTST